MTYMAETGHSQKKSLRKLLPSLPAPVMAIY
jgi:hypothetical protein